MKKNPENKEPTYTPMVEQYLQMKKSYGDIILFFRLGDFYEMFLEDAELCSKELQLFLTKKAAGNGTFIPMCGIPHHAYLSYAQKLIDRGYKVAICEQVEDPKLTKKLVKRDVVQIITPGANLDLNSSEHNYIASLSLDVRQAFLCYGDISTGEMKMLSLENSREKILEKILSLEIKELVLATNTDASLIMYLKENSTVCISYSNDTSYSIELEPLFVNLNDPRQIDAALRLFHYMTDVEKRELSYFKPVLNLMEKKSMKIDYSAQSNMELVKSLDGKTFGTLFWLLNKTETPMGTRYLKEQILNPSASLTEVERRLDLTELFVNHFLDRETLRDDLKGIFDMERLICRMGYENCNGHDLLQLKKSLQAIPKIRGDLERLCPLSSALQELYLRLGDYTDLVNLLESAISENCPITITEGEIFKRGYNADLDELISLTTDAKEWISNLEIQEKERTGIHNLRVGYNSVFGYYIEVSASQVPLVKPEFGYIRKQTIKTGERYITQELKEKEDKILRAKELRTSLEYRLFKELRKKLSSYTEKIQASSDAISELDYFLCLAYVASENNYIRPNFSLTNEISITKARHPILEKASPDVLFVANDYSMKADTDVLIITGPNMGGKSTYMKEFGLLVIMAQIGSFVPAESCEIPLFDALFTRIGASDNLIKGQSTFMTEMSEVAQALSQADSHSLFLFDEIGRGTATYDGMAIAQSIIEYIVKNIHCKTFFSTHYHEITKLSEKISAVKNIHCEVKEDDGHVTFLYKMKEGSMDRSYGVNVAKLAGLPDDLIERADELLFSLESRSNVEKTERKEVRREEKKDELREELKRLDPMTLSPLDALNYLIDLKKRIH
ncbi:MAG: DNA mismatch repair protein MutS [bacterium]|nr:DNA mismatch repair protein MutS [bacterium]MDD7212903.1 DNA mismatch repair protein MutS [bacterium]MDY2572115.1 DNA mismatch repair protein MutS [Candidatus Enterosoma sp.]MDY5547887.1 DNA mismatch repair protein MutS [Candidatus Enterosoma sp.]